MATPVGMLPVHSPLAWEGHSAGCDEPQSYLEVCDGAYSCPCVAHLYCGQYDVFLSCAGCYGADQGLVESSPAMLSALFGFHLRHTTLIERFSGHKQLWVPHHCVCCLTAYAETKLAACSLCHQTSHICLRIAFKGQDGPLRQQRSVSKLVKMAQGIAKYAFLSSCCCDRLNLTHCL